MANNFDLFFSRVLRDEGTAYEDVPGDNGGPTRCGLTIADIARWNGVKCPKRGQAGWDDLVEKVRAITPQTAAPIYKRFYWDEVRADELPSGLDYAVVDYGTNSGTLKAVKTLGGLVGVQGNKVTDEMITAIGRYGSIVDLVTHFQDSRRAYLEQISEIPHNMKFRKGWLDRERRVRAVAKNLAEKAQEASASVVQVTPPKAVDPSDIPSPPAPSKVTTAATSRSVWYGIGAMLTAIANTFKDVKDYLGNLIESVLGLLPSAVDASSSVTSALQSLASTIKADLGWLIAGITVFCCVRFILRHVDLKHGQRVGEGN